MIFHRQVKVMEVTLKMILTISDTMIDIKTILNLSNDLQKLCKFQNLNDFAQRLQFLDLKS